MNITLKAIWDSSTSLLKRFDLMPTRRAAWLKMQEELWELSEALDTLQGSRKTIPYRIDAADEVGDVLITVLNVAYTAGLTHEEIEKALVKGCAKNDVKTEATHEARDGMIKKRKPAPVMADTDFIDKAQLDASARYPNREA